MFVQVIIGALMVGSIYALVALGFSLIYRASGLLSFMQGEFFMLGAFLGLTFYSNIGLPFFVALVLTVVIMFIFGMILEKYVIRILLNQGAPGIVVVLSTIALSIMLQNFAMLTWGSKIFQFPPIFNQTYISIGEINIVPESILALLTAGIVMVVLHFFMTKSKIGTSMRAAAQSPMAASSLGINVSLTTGITWGLAAALAGIAGVLYGPVYGVSQVMGGTISIKGFAGACIGGYGNMYGAMVGSLVLGVIETATAGYFTSVYKDFVTYFILIIMLAVKPTGIFNAEVYDD